MPANKDRLYIGLYVRGGAPRMPGKEDTYHWGLIVGPKVETDGGRGTRYHAKERIVGPNRSEWVFEESEVPLNAAYMLLARVMVAKVEKPERLAGVVRQVPVRQGEPGWNCISWVREALEALRDDGKTLGTRRTEWQSVRDTVMWYMEKKMAEHRFDGGGGLDMSHPPTYDLIEGKETIL